MTHSVPKIVHDPLGRETTRDHRRGHARAGMRARAGEVQIAIARMLVLRAEVSQLAQIVTQSVRGAFHQIVAFLP